MDFKKLVERIKSSRNFKVAAIAAVVLAIAAGGGAYYFLVYQPQIESEAAAAKPPVVKKPQSAPPPITAKPAVAQPAASAVPVVVPEKQQPVVAHAPSTPALTPGKSDEAAKKIEPEKLQDAAMPEQAAKPDQVAKPEQAAKAGKETDTPNLKEESPQSRDPIPAAAPVAVEPAASVAADVHATRRWGITPKYNDVMTAVLRGDREATKELLDLGWWVDKPSENAITPLMAAVMNRDTQMVQLLLEYGAEPTLQALSLARKNNDAATAALLEQKGAR